MKASTFLIHVFTGGLAVEVEDDTGGVKKRKFRSRAHANPLADPQFEYPVSRESFAMQLLRRPL
eukprot:260909-Hanusia_phi.AAC.3